MYDGCSFFEENHGLVIIGKSQCRGMSNHNQEPSTVISSYFYTCYTMEPNLFNQFPEVLIWWLLDYSPSPQTIHTNAAPET